MNKFFLTPFRQRFSSLWVSQDQLDKWAKDWRFFFILGFGRSGTAFMAHFLNQAEGTFVYHEPVLEDFYAHAVAHYDQHSAERYMLGFRKKEIFNRTRHIAVPGMYGEVTGTLRCHANAIKKTFPGVRLLHLVRDGRDVVRSHTSRRIMTIKNPFSLSIHPTDSDPWKDRWSGMDRFARICWFWQEENRRLRTNIGKTVQFEKILSDYEYFSEQILQPLEINISKELWKSNVSTPRNTSSDFGMPKWDKWTTEQKKTFTDICGSEMSNYDYRF